MVKQVINQWCRQESNCGWCYECGNATAVGVVAIAMVVSLAALRHLLFAFRD